MNSPKPAGPLPDELMEQLHRANHHFHEARKNLEAQMEGTEYRHQDRVDAAAEGVRAAEREVEEVTDRIAKEMHGDEPVGTTPGRGIAPPAHGQQVADFEPLR
jgi:predicted NodU family carbamoyl transferase